MNHFLRATAVAATFLLIATLLAVDLRPVDAQAVMCGGLEATIVGTERDDFIEGTNRADVIATLGGDDVVFGNGGNDVICGGDGDDVLLGNKGVDTIFGENGNDEIAGSWVLGGNPETFHQFSRRSRLSGGPGDDDIWGTTGKDRISGGSGDDAVFGFDGNDRIGGGLGNDILWGHADIDAVRGGGGNDFISADRVDRKVQAGAGRDSCPLLTELETTWRGCDEVYLTADNNPLWPGVPLPAELSSGTADTWVYLAETSGDSDLEPIVLGTRADGGNIEFADGSNPFTFLHYPAVTPDQARAIAQSLIADFGVDATDFIDPELAYYDEAITWGREWLALNPRVRDPLRIIGDWLDVVSQTSTANSLPTHGRLLPSS